VRFGFNQQSQNQLFRILQLSKPSNLTPSAVLEVVLADVAGF
jgi:hypothetical protein